jgi:hypothetical protein
MSCMIPNSYARKSLARMLSTALKSSATEGVLAAMALAVQKRDYLAFTVEAMHLLESVPNVIIKKDTNRESSFQAALFAALRVCVPASVATVTPEYATQRGVADIVIRFSGQSAWLLEVGLGGEKSLATKVAQAQAYATAIDAKELLCCAVLVSEARPSSASVAASARSDGASDVAVRFAWTRRISVLPEPRWEALPLRASEGK